MSKNEEKKQTYVLIILRRDGEHLAISESADYDKMFEKYKELTSEWASCIKENKPFSIDNPVITTFDPGLIYEIKINPVVETAASKYDNPYAKEMTRSGLASMQNYKQDILDGGYR